MSDRDVIWQESRNGARRARDYEREQRASGNGHPPDPRITNDSAVGQGGLAYEK